LVASTSLAKTTQQNK